MLLIYLVIDFEDFIRIFMEFAKLEFNWEKDPIKGFTYFVNKRINHFPCLKKSWDDLNLERFYFFLEMKNIIKK